ncbi:BDM_1a_G0009020.mRNA.1.CDS.1 [Saccharomyces cerevisiae]|nr:CEQ_1a_G0007600.mRNA.1.CDS.1 [Saccharomyces cerevisiae]CAI4331756.1 BDM_1a_G0009020.mRNA.1.CDS.1 [Saccharomyces cerevisiae]CAI7068544.1 BDM_1a_G0009020.mRNA.1.CDS.1 [Saccharomyces cerevisiae]CAI7182074.1 CEQ_1a_G0007600.mRNA.1.CDS.1 [Saccharomyces cerevisiae]
MHSDTNGRTKSNNSPSDNNPNETVILIDSDKEEDASIREANLPVRLYPDRRVGRRRDALNRFVRSGSRSRNSQRTHITASSERPDFQANNDDITIIREVGRFFGDDGPIDPSAHYVDLDQEPGSETLETPRTIQVDNTNGYLNDNGNNNESDDGLTIVEERTTRPRVTLNLPGGERLEVTATTTDIPIRRSFEFQEDLGASRRQLLRRSATRARNLFVDRSDENDEDWTDDTHNLPEAIQRARRESRMRMSRRIAERQRRVQQQRVSSDENISTSIRLQSIRERIQSYTPDIRSAFHRAESLHEFRSILQNVAPITLQECEEELMALFTEFRNQLLQNWAIDRVRNTQEEALRLHREALERQERTAGRVFHRGTLRESITNYLNFNGEDGFLSRLWSGPALSDADEERHTQNIIDMIQEREERERDVVMKNLMNKTRAQQEEFEARAASLPEGYSASFDTTPKMKLDITKNGKEETIIVTDDDLAKTLEDIPVCCLCGAELGVGIPDDFTGISQKDRGVSFEGLVSKYKFHCPYQTLARPSMLDRDLSKRTFIASCGHAFCGRCFARIDNAKKKSKMPKKKLAQLKGSAHPDNYGPKLCPADSCKKLIRSRGRLKEVYF